jgi:catechol 2,3-dioxygenase
MNDRPPELARLGHVALTTPDLETSLSFWKDVVGLEDVETVDETVYLRARGEREHHTLSLKAGSAASVDHIGWQTKRSEDVDLFAERVAASGVDIHVVAEGEEPGQGRGIRFVPPSGHVFEIYHDIEKRPSPQKSRLPNAAHSLASAGVGARRIDHINLHAPDVAACVPWFEDVLGFKNREFIVDDDDRVVAAWMSVTPLVHDMAVRSAPDAQPGDFNHVAYWVDNWQDVLRAADILTEHNIAMYGPGRHGITQGVFLYVLDPASGHKLEIFSGSYLILDPTWEPIKWRPEDLDVGIVWWGAREPGFPRDHHTPTVSTLTASEPAETGLQWSNR